ncbi:MAG: molybdopterin dehydrogenase [Clostridiales bacterium]|nr:MAG: molybdopterin dehydrogenase [Clostridiales bacterium]
MGSIVARDLNHVLDVKSERPGIVLYGGGTDLMVEAAEVDYLFLHQVKELKTIEEDANWLTIGAGCSFTEVYDYAGTPSILKEAIAYLAAPAIRNLGTIGGNVGNGSAKADTSLIFFALDGIVNLASKRGKRSVPIKEFYLDRKKLAIESDEIITSISLPKANYGSYYYKKIGARKALAISRLDFVGVYRIVDGKIDHLAVAIGAIAPVIIRRPDFDNMLIGLTIEQAKAARADYLAQYDDIIQPINGRVSAYYRKTVTMNLLNDFLDNIGL